MKTDINVEAQTISWTFDDTVAPIVLHADKISDSNAVYATLYGLQVRGTRAAAIVRKNPKTGVVIEVTEAMRRTEIARIVEHLESGAEAWDVGARPSFNPMVQELAAALGCDYATAKIKFDERIRAEFNAMVAEAKSAE